MFWAITGVLACLFLAFLVGIWTGAKLADETTTYDKAWHQVYAKALIDETLAWWDADGSYQTEFVEVDYKWIADSAEHSAKKEMER